MVFDVTDIKNLELFASLEEKESSPIVENIVEDPNKSTTFDENILTLANKLRENGFVIYADSLEKKFLTYKTAKTHMYRAIDEDGSDVIEFAHPNGDKNMSDGELGDVETILSQHKKIVDMVNKQPTGKLASYLSTIVNQCKIALGQDSKILANQAVSYLDKASQDLQELKKILKLHENKLRIYVSTFDIDEDNLQNLKNSLSENTVDTNKRDIQLFANRIKELIEKLELSSKNYRATTDEVNAALDAMGTAKLYLRKIYAAGWALQNELAGAEFQTKQIDTRKIAEPVNKLISGLQNVKYYTDSAINDQTREQILNMQKIANNIILVLRGLLSSLVDENNKPLDVVVFDHVKNFLSRSKYFKNVNTYETFLNDLNSIKEMFNQGFEDVSAMGRI